MVTAIVSGRDGVRDLARRTLRWRVPLRWYAIALLTPSVVLLAAVTALYGTRPLRTLADNWPLLLTSFLPTLVVMVVLNSVAEEAGFTGFLFARLQVRHGPMRPLWSRPSSSGSSTSPASSATPGRGCSPPR